MKKKIIISSKERCKLWYNKHKLDPVWKAKEAQRRYGEGSYREKQQSERGGILEWKSLR